MLHRRTELWLWPVPEGDALSLVLQWHSVGVEETTHRLDLSEARQAAAKALPFWS